MNGLSSFFKSSQVLEIALNPKTLNPKPLNPKII